MHIEEGISSGGWMATPSLCGAIFKAVFTDLGAMVSVKR
jgi:hypothetical protein